MNYSRFKTITNLLLVIACSFLLQSCAFGITENLKDGYDFGDLTLGAIEDVRVYCDSDNAMTRAAARAGVVASTGVKIPDAVCPLWNSWKSDNGLVSTETVNTADAVRAPPSPE